MKLGEYKAPDQAGLRRFGLTTGLIFVGLFGLALPLVRHRAIPYWPYVPGVPLVALGVLLPRALAPVHRIWMTAGGALGWINTRIILTIVFFLIVTPLGIVRRLVGKDALGRRFERAAKSYRIESEKIDPDRIPERMKVPF